MPMKAYTPTTSGAKRGYGYTKGYAGLRKSKASPHRKRCLRVDKKAARDAARRDVKGQVDDL